MTVDVQPLDRWNAAQLGLLRQLALSTLYRLVPLTPGVFKTADAAEVLIKFMQDTSNVKHMEAAMKVIRRLAQQHISLRPWLADSRVVQHAKSCLQDVTMTDSVHSDAVLMLHSAIETCDFCTAAFMSEKLIEPLISILDGISKKDSSMPNYMLMHTLSLIWTAMYRDSGCCAEILSNSGARCLFGVGHVLPRVFDRMGTSCNPGRDGDTKKWAWSSEEGHLKRLDTQTFWIVQVFMYY